MSVLLQHRRTATMQTTPTLAFYSHRPEKYLGVLDHLHCLSNFSPHGLTLDGKWYATSEHRFQAAKPEDPVRRELVRLASSPAEAAAMGRDRAHPLRADWEQVKEQVMLEALRAKFTQNDYCYEALMSTGDAHLEERTRLDAYWGTGSDTVGGTGRNRLGHLLVQVRTELRAKSN